MSALAIAIRAELEAEPVRAVVWLIEPGKAPRPILTGPFDRDRMEAEHKAAGTVQERNARILRARIPPHHLWRRDTAASAHCQSSGRTYGEQRALIDDTTPAAALGVSPIQAAVQYGRPYREMYRAYVWGHTGRAAPIGRRDHFDCWWASSADLAATFGDAAAQRRMQATTPEHMSRTAERMARRQRAQEGGRG